MEPGGRVDGSIPQQSIEHSSLPGRGRPQFAVFTVRPGARQRLSHLAVLERYQSLGAKIYRTDRDEAITFLKNGKSIQVNTFLKL